MEWRVHYDGDLNCKSCILAGVDGPVCQGGCERDVSGLTRADWDDLFQLQRNLLQQPHEYTASFYEEVFATVARRKAELLAKPK